MNMEWQMSYGTDTVQRKSCGGKTVQNQDFGDMRGGKIEIDEGAVDFQGNPVPGGIAYIYKGGTGTIPPDYAAVILEGDIANFRQISKRYIKTI